MGPTREQLWCAWRDLEIGAPFENALAHPCLGIVIRLYAELRSTRQPAKPAKPDLKKLMANDVD